MVDSAKWGRTRSNSHCPNLGRVFRLFSLDTTHGIYIYISVIFRESHSIISLSSVFYRLATNLSLLPPCLRLAAAGLISKCPGKSRTIHYISRIIISPYES